MVIPASRASAGTGVPAAARIDAVMSMVMPPYALVLPDGRRPGYLDPPSGDSVSLVPPRRPGAFPATGYPGPLRRCQFIVRRQLPFNFPGNSCIRFTCSLAVELGTWDTDRNPEVIGP
jgi:hypothetical protein